MSTLATTGPAAAPLPFRLRTVMGLLFLASAVAMAVPRARAAWRLHGLVTKVADYGLCMAGPTGAQAIRDDLAQFRKLVRRRLLAAEAADRPFARCAQLASEISGRAEIGPRHQQPAADFIEWGAGGQQQSLNELLGILPDLVSLHAESWPLARKPLWDLLRPSRGAYEAVHPMEPARPASLHGLLLDGAVIRSTLEGPKGQYLVLSNDRDVWAMRSRDHGLNWAVTSAWQSALDGHAHHCVADAMGTRFTLAPPRAGLAPALQLGTLTSINPDRREFGSVNDTVLRLVCDSTGAATLVQRKSDRSHHVFACPLAGNCREVTLPVLAQQRDVLIDVARLAHTIVVALSRDGLVRVTTSRDEGASLTPLSLVFDARDAQLAGLDAVVVPSLLGFEKHLELALGGPGAAAHWALVSDDFGASFRGI